MPIPDIPAAFGDSLPATSPRSRRERNDAVDGATTTAFLVASVGTTVSRTLGRYSFYWPIVGIGITIIGLNIADAAGPQ